jgi:hypothetical protein
LIAYTDILDGVLSNLEMDGSDAENIARFNVDNNIQAAYRTVCFMFPKKHLKSAARYFKQNLVTSGVHEILKDKYLRLIDIYVDYFNEGSSTDNIVPGYKALHHSQVDDFYAGKSFYQPVYEDKVTTDDKLNITIKPLPPTNVTNGLIIHAVENLTIDASNPCPLDISLKDALIAFATHLSALTDGYNPDLAAGQLKTYEAILRGFVEENSKVVTQ